MKISEVRRDTLKEQRAIMAKITAKRIRIDAYRAKMAALHDEIGELQAELVQVSAENIAWWDGYVPVDQTEPVGCSEMNVPMPTVVVEKVRIGANGVTSNFDGVGR